MYVSPFLSGEQGQHSQHVAPIIVLFCSLQNRLGSCCPVLDTLLFLSLYAHIAFYSNTCDRCCKNGSHTIPSLEEVYLLVRKSSRINQIKMLRMQY